MSKCRLLAAATLFSAIGAALPATSAAAECVGELTLQRLATADCAARIPLPTLRPDMRSGRETSSEVAKQEWEYIEAPGAAPGETRRVRLVGNRFLPDSSEEIDFRRRSAANADLLNALVNRTAAYITEAKVDAVAQASEPEPEVVQEARVSLQLSQLPD